MNTSFRVHASRALDHMSHDQRRRETDIHRAQTTPGTPPNLASRHTHLQRGFHSDWLRRESGARLELRRAASSLAVAAAAVAAAAAAAAAVYWIVGCQL